MASPAVQAAIRASERREPADVVGSLVSFGPSSGSRPWTMRARGTYRCPECSVNWIVQHEAEWEYPVVLPCPMEDCDGEMLLTEWPLDGPLRTRW